MMSRSFLAACYLGLRASLATAQAAPDDNIVSIPQRDTFVLSPGFNGTFATYFAETESTDDRVGDLLSLAQNATFISFDGEFLELIGPNPTQELLAESLTNDGAYEAGAFVPSENTLWFTGGSEAGITVRTAKTINLDTNEVIERELSPPLRNPNGGRYFEGKVYFAVYGNFTAPGGVAAVDPRTGETEYIVNSYFGMRFNSVNDLAWAKRGDKKALFFSDVDFGAFLNVTGPPQLPNAVWRFDPDTELLTSVISRADILHPNGVAVDPTSSKLYVTDTPRSALGGLGPGNDPDAAAIFVYDLDENLFPVQKRLFAIARKSAPDGIKIDRKGRVWTGEGEGIVVRSPQGKVLGLFNALTLVRGEKPHIANFGLVNDSVVALALDQIWSLKLGEVVSW